MNKFLDGQLCGILITGIEMIFPVECFYAHKNITADEELKAPSFELRNTESILQIYVTLRKIVQKYI